MQQCSICKKPIYGRPTPRRQKRVNGVTIVENGDLVCGSCPLNRKEGAASGKSYSDVRMDMAKLVTKPTSRTEEETMTLKVRSNVKNRTILLDGRFPIVFGSDGIGKCPPQHRELFEREMAMKPGRFSFVVEEPTAVEPEPEVVAPVVEEVVVEAVPEEEVPAAIDQSFLVAEEVTEPVKPVKASKKK